MQIRIPRSAIFVGAITVALAAFANAQQLADAPSAAPAAFVMAANSKTLPEAKATPDPKPAPAITLALAPRERPRAHRFFDRVSLLSTSAEAGALFTDGYITKSTLGQIRTEYRSVNGVQTPYQVQLREVDPVGKLFVNHGWGGLIAGGVMTIGADLSVRYWLHKTNHHKLERIVPFAIAASNAFAAWHDTRY